MKHIVLRCMLYSDTYFGEEAYDEELWDRFLEALAKEENTCVQCGD